MYHESTRMPHNPKDNNVEKKKHIGAWVIFVYI